VLKHVAWFTKVNTYQPCWNGFNTVELKYFGTGKKSYLSSEQDREEERGERKKVRETEVRRQKQRTHGSSQK